MKPSRRLSQLPAYAAAEVVAIKRRLVAEGRDVIDLGAGDADFAPPDVAVRALADALRDPAMSRYGFQIGHVPFREAIVRYMKRRFGVDLDPIREVLPLLGSKEGLAHLPFAVLDPGDVAIVPEPGYPAYGGGVALAGAEAAVVGLRAERQYLVEPGDVPAAQLARARLMFLNYPNNPTTAIAPRPYLERVLAACRQRDILLAYDNPYCDLTFDGYQAPSILEFAGARDTAVEFHSLSKSFCMTGWRIGWVCGNADVIAALAKAKTYIDTGPFLALQAAGAAVLDAAASITPPLVRAFRERRDATVDALRAAGLPVEPPPATMYLWVPLPAGVASGPFARQVLEEQGVVILHGSSFGAAGEGFFRLALTLPPERIRAAVDRLGRVLERVGGAHAPR